MQLIAQMSVWLDRWAVGGVVGKGGQSFASSKLTSLETDYKKRNRISNIITETWAFLNSEKYRRLAQALPPSLVNSIRRSALKLYFSRHMIFCK